MTDTNKSQPRCSSCRKILRIINDSYEPCYCRSEYGYLPYFRRTMMGWICPRCQKVHSPWSMGCDCPPLYNIKSSHTTKEDTNE